jgi:dicarboxylate transporter 10
MCGFLSALVTATVSAPVDLVRNHVMTLKTPESATSVAASIYRDCGIRGLFRGWLPSFYRFGPHFTISWPLIELARTRIFGLDSF